MFALLCFENSCKQGGLFGFDKKNYVLSKPEYAQKVSFISSTDKKMMIIYVHMSKKTGSNVSFWCHCHTCAEEQLHDVTTTYVKFQ